MRLGYKVEVFPGMSSEGELVRVIEKVSLSFNK